MVVSALGMRLNSVRGASTCVVCPSRPDLPVVTAAPSAFVGVISVVRETVSDLPPRSTTAPPPARSACALAICALPLLMSLPTTQAPSAVVLATAELGVMSAVARGAAGILPSWLVAALGAGEVASAVVSAMAGGAVRLPSRPTPTPVP
jgi:hypothetical protein